MAQEARVIHLQKDLIEMGNLETLRALNLMIGIMNSDNGYSRHDGSHYYYHLVDGCQDLINHGFTDQNLLTAFVLHDAEEDIPEFSHDYIAEKFNGEVAMLVSGVTKKIGVDYKDKDGKNMEEYLTNMYPFVKMMVMKTADRKHNFSTLEHASPEKELRQALETEKHYLPFFKEGRKLYSDRLYSAYFHSAKTTIVPHLKRIIKANEDKKAYEKRIEELEFKMSLLVGGKK